MQIEKNKVVTFHYDLREETGEIIESSRKSDPIAYLHGHRGIIKGLEKEMAGKQAGDQFTATISPEHAYGLRQQVAQQRIPIKHLASKHKKLKVGQVVGVNTANGIRQATVVKVGRFNVDVDTNHPLAGKTLVFDVSIVDVRDASAEEIAHKHVHGPGGHQH